MTLSDFIKVQTQKCAEKKHTKLSLPLIFDIDIDLEIFGVQLELVFNILKLRLGVDQLQIFLIKARDDDDDVNQSYYYFKKFYSRFPRLMSPFF